MSYPPSPVRKRAFSLIAALAAISTPAIAAPEPHTGKHFVWRVTNAKAPTFLVGSIHALSYSDYPLPSCYRLAVMNSSKVIFEFPPDESKRFPVEFEHMAEYPNNGSLVGKVHKETYDFLVKSCRNSSIQYQEMLKYRPWAIAFYIWGVRGINDVYSDVGVDYHLLKMAKAHGKQVGGLVSLRDHLRVLSEMSDIESEVLLLNAMVRGDKRRQDFDKLRAIWKRGDVEGLWAFDKETTNWPTSLERRFLDDRNRKWIPKIEAEIKAGTPVTIVAGAAHFAGPASVIKMLRQKGYTVEQM